MFTRKQTMTSADMEKQRHDNETFSWRNPPPLFWNMIIVVVCAVLAFGASQLYVVNTNDNDIHRRMAALFFRAQPMYETAPEIRYVNIYLPHAPLLIAPFTILGARYSAFWDVFLLLLLFTLNARTWLALGSRLLVIAAPLMLFVIAAANVSGTTTSIGLLLILTGKRGLVRGLAWAFLLVRPQETLFILAIDGVLALFQRDWKAIALTLAFLLFPIFVYNPLIYLDWVTALTQFAEGGTNPIGFAEVYGILPAIALLLGIVAVRSFTFARTGIRRRPLSDIPVGEFYWFLIISIFVLGPYTRLYAVWHLFLLTRYSTAWRTTAIFVITTLIGIVYLAEWDLSRFSIGIVLSMVTVAVLASRQTPDANTRTLDQLFRRKPSHMNAC